MAEILVGIIEQFVPAAADPTSLAGDLNTRFFEVSADAHLAVLHLPSGSNEAAGIDLASADGLTQSCRVGQALGLDGRTAVHPRQVEVIRAAFAPTVEEVAWAEEVLAALDATGIATLKDCSMVDGAMALRAKTVLGC